MHKKIGQLGLTYKDVYHFILHPEKIEIDNILLKKVRSNREELEKKIAMQQVMYGITTGFGAFKTQVIAPKDAKKLQENLILSHAVGVGKHFDEPIVRGIMIIMINYLLKGNSGVRPIVIETLQKMVRSKIVPAVPEKGSVGSSGDLAPSSHVILVLLGKGEAYYDGKLLSGAEAMKRAKIKPIELAEKEGLALINNTATMTSNATHALGLADAVVDASDIVACLSAEALRATPNAFDKRIHDLKPHPGQIAVAKSIREKLKGSTMVDKTKIQDQYSIRCIPQIHGAVRGALNYVQSVVDIEVNSVTDNPLIFSTNDGIDVISGGNFHGESVAIAMDTLGIAISEIGNISDRRSASILDGATNNGLPPFLADVGGINSGMMIIQYTTAALASENKVLAHPASVDSIPTSANVEDIVSMGTIASRKAREIIGNVENILTLEALIACQAIDFRLKDGFQLSPYNKKVYQSIRKIVPHFSTDTEYYPYFKPLKELLLSGKFKT